MRRRRTGKTKGKLGRSLNRRVTKIERNLRAILDSIAVDFTQSSVALDATPTVTHITPGTGADGVKSKLLSFEIQGVIKQNLASAIIDDYRIDLVLDRQPNKVAITPLVFYGSATPTTERLLIVQQQKRFRIIKSWRGYLSSSEGSNSFRKFGGTFKLNLMCISTVDANFADTNLLKNNISLIFWTTASANQPLLTFRSRLMFIE